MNNEEIDYWLRYFSNHNHGFMSEDGKKITLFKVFQELKELHYLLKIKNDYIKELEAYKYNMDRDYLRLEKENQELKKELEEKNKPQIFIDTQDIEERYAEGLYQDYLEEENKKYKNQQKEFVDWLENEKDRLARECSRIYVDSLGKTRLVSEDIFNEVDKILSKYEEIIEK